MDDTTLFFYDLETSGFNPREARVMQFAGQRTLLDLEPLGEPINRLIKFTEDVVPDPDAILTTDITPQSTISEGLTEAEFLKEFYKEIAKPNTIFVGFNNIRFDDEFLRFLHYRNFYDAYEWQWQNGRSRWDLLDMIRMTRALRPNGITWPLDKEGRPTNRLELLAKANDIEHRKAHDALSDVRATIQLAKLIHEKQPKLFRYLLEMRDKQKISQLVESGLPFVYSSGKYPSEFEKTSVVSLLAKHPHEQAALVYDLRHDPSIFAELSVPALVKAWQQFGEDNELKLPVKTLKYNRSPAVAPLTVLTSEAQERIGLSLELINKHLIKLRDQKEFPAKVLEALQLLDKDRERISHYKPAPSVDAQLYSGFFDAHDKDQMQKIRHAIEEATPDVQPDFHDKRLRQLMPLYIARNYPNQLDDESRATWNTYRKTVLLGGAENSRMARYQRRITELSTRTSLSAKKRKLLDELIAWGETVNPSVFDVSGT